MLNHSIKPNQISKDNPFKEYFEVEENNNRILEKSINFSSEQYFGNIIGEKRYRETIIEKKINKQLNEKK